MLTIGSLQSCRDKDLEPSLEQQKDINSISSAEDVKAFLNGIYSKMRDKSYLGLNMTMYGEVRTDNAFANASGTGRFTQVGGMAYSSTLNDTAATWYRIYEVIARCNFIINKGIEGLSGDQNELKHYLGEAYAIRAMAHFDLVRLFGQTYIDGQGGMNSLGVPYVKIYKGDPNNLFPQRNTVQEDYNLAKEDIQKAVSLMDGSDDDRFEQGEAYYMISTAAWALLSKMAIYFKDYSTAKTAAKKVLDDSRFSIVGKDDYISSWKSAKKTPKNVIFSLYAQSDTEALGIESLGSLYRKINSSGYGDVMGLEDLYNVFGDKDIRKDEEMSSKPEKGFFINLGKYVDNSKGADDIPIFRYEEAVLDYSEALLKTGDTANALVWLNKIPQNRGASNYSSVTLDNIILERRKEFAFEGLRFDDLVRTGKGIPSVDNSKQLFTEAIPSGDYRLAFPIPDTEMKVNHNMKQNKGY